jgi:hypothetical protein
MKRTVLALALVGLLIPGAADAKKRQRNPDRDRDKPQHERALSMEKGTWQLGGSATVDVTTFGGETDFALRILPNAGYFVADKFEILGLADVAYVAEETYYSVGAGVKYHFDLKPSWFYLGAMASYGDWGYTTTDIGVMAGLLYPLARNVALDLGVRADMYMPEVGDNYYGGSLGYLGVQAYWR